MPRRLVTILGWILGVFGIALVLFWMILSSPLFSDFRRSLVETALSDAIGQPFIVRDDVRVRVRLSQIARVFVTGVEIPSENIGGTNLAELKHLELDVDFVSLLRGRLFLDNLSIEGLLVNMTRQQDGTTSWTPEDTQIATSKPTLDAANEGVQIGNKDDGILFFLSDKTASFTDISLKIDNQDSGFLFDFNLSSLLLEQLENGQLASLTSKGTVNNEAFLIDGKFPRGKPFTTKATFGELRLDFNGRPLTSEEGAGFAGTLTLDTGEIGEALDILRLDRVLEGNGHLSADIFSQKGVLKIEDLKTNIAFADGSSFDANGKLGNLLNTTGFDLTVDVRLYPENQPPVRAVDFKSLELTGITAHIVSEGSALIFEDLNFLTNSFDPALKQVGPVRIGKIQRTPEGLLSLLDIYLQMGPSDAPYVVANGKMTNVLQLKGLDFAGKLTAPASLVLRDLPNDKIEAFGSLNAEFAVTDASGNLSLTNLEAYTEGTDLWSLQASSAVPNVTTLENLTFSLDLDIADGAAFLAALDLEPVDVGAVEFTASATGHKEKFATTASIAVKESRLSVDLDTKVTDGNSVIRGMINSRLLRINDLQKGVDAVLELATLSSKADQPGNAASDGSTVSSDWKIEEPLVLGTADADDAKSGVAADDKPEEPLVLSTGDADDTKSDIVADDKPEEPLVLGAVESKATDLVDPVEMLVNLDLEIGIEIDEISGPRGRTKVSSELEVKEAKARFGPLEFSYGGGYFSLRAAMDLLKTPDLLTVSGATSGWDLGEILKTARLDIDANGKLRGRFNLTGNRKSAKAFVNSIFGSATVSMSNGAIATSLLELAGLGVFPWLFSAELKQGYTNIVCAVAPLNIQAGRVSSNSIVVETNRVQMVISGSLDWKKDSISMRAEPRPVGRPLARSAWPFSVTGALSKPNFKVHAGGSRSKRADGASKSPTERKPCVPDIHQLK